MSAALVTSNLAGFPKMMHDGSNDFFFEIQKNKGHGGQRSGSDPNDVAIHKTKSIRLERRHRRMTGI